MRQTWNVRPNGEAGPLGIALQPPPYRIPTIDSAFAILNQRVVYRRAAQGDSASPLPPAGAGQRLPPNVQNKMERAFASDFSAVRIHRDARAAALHARAYTQGSAIHLTPSSASLQSVRGQELLGHELAHVMQQRQGLVRPTGMRRGLSINQDPTLERAADHMGRRAAKGLSVGEAGRTGHSSMGLLAPVAGTPAQLLAAVPQVRKQKGGTCGCYALWMALESLVGVDDALIDFILAASRETGSLLGENFTYQALANVVDALNTLLKEDGRTYQVQIQRRGFANRAGFEDLVANSSDTEALMIGYDCSVLDWRWRKAADKAHWSLIENFDLDKKTLILANPWGVRNRLSSKALYKANTRLANTTFDWAKFADKHFINLHDGVRQSRRKRAWADLMDYAVGINGTLLEVVMELGSAKSERKQEKEELDGFLVSVTTAG